jgi:hypothetical protein
LYRYAEVIKAEPEAGAGGGSGMRPIEAALREAGLYSC